MHAGTSQPTIVNLAGIELHDRVVFLIGRFVSYILLSSMSRHFFRAMFLHKISKSNHRFAYRFTQLSEYTVA